MGFPASLWFSHKKGPPVCPYQREARNPALPGTCLHGTETFHGRFRARRIPSRNYGIASRHGASRNITDVMGITARISQTSRHGYHGHHGHHGVNHGCITPCCIIAKWKLVVRQRHSSAVHHRGSQHAIENYGVSRRSRNITDITEFVT